MKKEKDIQNPKGKLTISKIIAGVLTFLAVLNLGVLFLFPELPVKLMGKGGEPTAYADENDGKGSGMASLTVEETKRAFDGNGIFDPMKGVKAFDNDGTDITRKVSYSFVSGKTVSEKEIRYTFYDSKNEKLTASVTLSLENYSGPSIEIGEIPSVTWDELQRLTEILVSQGKLKGDDGFGNDASGLISHSFEIEPDGQFAEVTFSLINQFQDFRSEKVRIGIKDLPDDAFINETFAE